MQLDERWDLGQKSHPPSHSMGTVKEKYLHYKKAGDLYIEQVVSGIDGNNSVISADDKVQKNDELIHSYLVEGMTVENRIFEIFQSTSLLLYVFMQSFCIEKCTNKTSLW